MRDFSVVFEFWDLFSGNEERYYDTITARTADDARCIALSMCGNKAKIISLELAD